MMKKPLSRVTKHKNPRYQLYQPGFNPSNSCWLQGKYITLSKEEWEARKDAHEAMYANWEAEQATQHYRNPETPIDQLTPAQRQAFEYYSGEAIVTVRNDVGQYGPFAAETAGGKMTEECVDFFRKNGIKVLSHLTEGRKVWPQFADGFVPEDIVEDTSQNPVDPGVEIVKQNREQERDMFSEMLKGITPQGVMDTIKQLGEEGPLSYFGDQRPSDEEPIWPVSIIGTMSEMCNMLVYQQLIEWEGEIIRDEWEGQPTDESVARYVEGRRLVKSQAGDQFEAQLAKARESNNECARANLDNSDGRLFCWVLPLFKDDGSHEPVGERDVPWNLNPHEDVLG